MALPPESDLVVRAPTPVPGDMIKILHGAIGWYHEPRMLLRSGGSRPYDYQGNRHVYITHSYHGLVIAVDRSNVPEALVQFPAWGLIWVSLSRLSAL
jgi:hypothetical protein